MFTILSNFSRPSVNAALHCGHRDSDSSVMIRCPYKEARISNDRDSRVILSFIPPASYPVVQKNAMPSKSRFVVRTATYADALGIAKVQNASFVHNTPRLRPLSVEDPEGFEQYQVCVLLSPKLFSLQLRLNETRNID